MKLNVKFFFVLEKGYLNGFFTVAESFEIIDINSVVKGPEKSISEKLPTDL